MKRDLFSTVPNIVSSARLLLSPILLYTIPMQMHKTSLFVFSVLAFTDFIDGYIARTCANQKSDTGVLLDPIADKVLSTMTLVPLSLTGIIPYSFSAISIAKDVMILSQGAKMLNSSSNVEKFIKQVSPYKIGKISFALQSFFILRVLLSLSTGGPGLFPNLAIISSVCNVLTLISYSQRHPKNLERLMKIIST